MKPYKEPQSKYGLYEEPIFSVRKDMQYPSKQKSVALDTIPEKAISVIQKFSNPQVQTPEYNELEVCVPIWNYQMEKTLEYALTSGTAYIIENEEIYIWYKPFKGLEGAGFYKLKRFAFSKDGSMVEYFLDGNKKLPNPL